MKNVFRSGSGIDQSEVLTVQPCSPSAMMEECRPANLPP